MVVIVESPSAVPESCIHASVYLDALHSVSVSQVFLIHGSDFKNLTNNYPKLSIDGVRTYDNIPDPHEISPIEP